jgi:two-component system, sensor histidine kinase
VFLRTRLLQPSFKALLTGCLLGLTFAAVLPVTYWGAQMVRKSMESDADEHLHESALLVRNTVEVYLQLHQAAVTSLSATLAPGHKLGNLDIGLTSRQLHHTASSYSGFLTMLVTDREGYIVRAIRRGGASFRPGPGENRRVEDRAYFREPRQTHTPFVSGVFQGRGLGRDVIVAMSAPILAKDGTFAGVVEGSIDITRIPLRPAARHHSPAVVALDRANKIVYSNRPEQYPPLSQWTAPWQSNRDQYVVVYPLQPYDWRVVALLPSEMVEAEVRAFYRNVAIGLVLIAGVILFAAERVARMIASPVVDLENAMRHYRLDGEVAATASTRFVPAEIAQIQAEFHTLSHRVRDAYRHVKEALRARDATNQQLQEVLGDLDRKVTDRTRQLAESESRYRHVVEHSGDLIYQTTTRRSRPCLVATSSGGAFRSLSSRPPANGSAARPWISCVGEHRSFTWNTYWSRQGEIAIGSDRARNC